MGNCTQIFNSTNYNKGKINNSKSKTNNNISASKVKKIFKSYNVLDTDINIIVGTWDNPNKSNTLGNQGIWIENYDHIHELIFGIKSTDTVILNFDKNITLKITKTKLSEYLLELTDKSESIYYSTNIKKNILGNLKKINDNSPDLDLILSIL